MTVRFKETEVEVGISGFVRTVGCESRVDFKVEPNGYFRIAMGDKGLVKFFDQADAIVEIENKYPEKMDYLQNVDPRLIVNLMVDNTKTELQDAVKQIFLDLKNEIDAVERRVNGEGRMARINGQLVDVYEY